MNHRLKITGRIKQRAPMVRSIKCFLIIRRASRQRLYRLLTLVFRRFRQGVFQQISRIYTPSYRLETLINLQNTWKSKPGRLLHSGGLFEHPNRNHINRNSALHRTNVDVRNFFRPNLLNQYNWFLGPTIQTGEYKSLIQHYASSASTPVGKANNHSVVCHNTFQAIFGAIRRFYSNETTVTSRSSMLCTDSKPAAASLDGKPIALNRATLFENDGEVPAFRRTNNAKRVRQIPSKSPLKRSLKLFKKSSSESDIESLDPVNKPRKRKKGATEDLRYSYPHALVKDQMMSAELDRSLRRKRTVHDTELAYRQNPEPTFAQKPGKSNKATEMRNPKIDIDVITEDVMRKINTKIRIERERKGLL